MRGCSWLILLGIALSPISAHAQGNDSFAPTGGRSVLMGNTGVALASDGSAPFSNPATIVRIRDERLAFSVNFYALSLMHFSNFHEPGAVDTSLFGKTNADGTGLLVPTFRVLPSTLCLFFTLQDLAQLDGKAPVDLPPEHVPRTKLAVCFAALESDDVDLQAIRFNGTTPAGPTSQVQSLQRRWSRTFFGLTYSTYLNRNLAIGASLQVAYSYNSFGINSSSLSNKLGGGTVASTLGTSGSGYSFELTSVLGVSYHYEPFTFGASLRLPSLHVFSAYKGSFNRSTAGADNDAALVASASGSMRSSAPVRAAAGIGFVWKKLTLELDGAVDLPISDELSGDFSVSTSRSAAAGLTQLPSHEKYGVRDRVTFDPSMGAEYFMSPTFSVLSGISANFTSLEPLHPAPSVGNLVQARTNHVGAALGIGSYWQGGEMLLGFQFDFGWGQALVANPYVVPNDWAIVDTQAYSLTFVIAGATDLGAIIRMVRQITQGVPPPARVPPATAAPTPQLSPP